MKMASQLHKKGSGAYSIYETIQQSPNQQNLAAKKSVYGLADASVYYYVKIREELCKVGGRLFKLD